MTFRVVYSCDTCGRTKERSGLDDPIEAAAVTTCFGCEREKLVTQTNDLLAQVFNQPEREVSS